MQLEIYVWGVSNVVSGVHLNHVNLWNCLTMAVDLSTQKGYIVYRYYLTFTKRSLSPLKSCPFKPRSIYHSIYRAGVIFIDRILNYDEKRSFWYSQGGNIYKRDTPNIGPLTYNGRSAIGAWARSKLFSCLFVKHPDRQAGASCTWTESSENDPCFKWGQCSSR